MNTTAQIRILMPSIIDPFSHQGGAGSVTRGLLKVLMKAPLNAQATVLSVRAPLSRLSHRVRQCASFALAISGRLPAKIAFTYSRNLLDGVRRQIAAQHWDLFLLNGADLLWLLEEVPPDIPVVLIAHNIEHSLYRSQLESSGLLDRPIGRWLDRDCQRLEAFEWDGLRRARNVIFLSTADADEAYQSCPNLCTLVVPPLFDEARVERAPRVRGGGPVEVLFLADFTWWPNQEGFRWFMEKVFPDVGDKVRLHVAGKGSMKLDFRHPNLVKHGFLASTKELWNLADILICPIYGGGGVKVKLAHALYHGVPVLATTLASRGLPLPCSESVTVLDGSEAWIQFFRTGNAENLACARVSQAASDKYALAANVASIQAYVASVLKATATKRSGLQLRNRLREAPYSKLHI
jgi:glycosyltransferase involved in cell wall biosynthesis